ncbi:MAG: DEAD/DEAH box helicase family protein [Nitrososphaerales archaeon]
MSTEVAVEGAKFVPTKLGEVEVPARCRNTHAVLLGDRLVASPVVIWDAPRVDPALGPDFKTLADRSQLLEALSGLTQSEKAEFASKGLAELVPAILGAMSEALPHIEHLYKWQSDAIQRIVKRHLKGDSSPFVLRAPTGKGKTLVFAFAALLSALRSPSPGTKVVLTFPTRALTAQQLNEFVAMVYRLNAKGIKKVRVGLYMGKGGRLGSVDARFITEGDPLPHISKCPECHQGEIVAHKEGDEMVIPKCARCGTLLDFVILSDTAAEHCPPDVLIATLDKLWYSVTQNIYSHTLFGASSRICKTCGTWHMQSFVKYTKDDATCRMCKAQLPPGSSKSSIGLLVFDEVHSLYATTGNLTAHFISLLKKLNTEYGNEDISIIGATATVANEKTLIQNLVNSDPEIFPSEEDFDNYFVKTDDLQYRFVVTEPLDKSTRTLISRGVESYDRFVREVKSAASSELKALVAEIKTDYPDFVAKYEQEFVYVNRKKDGSTLQKTIYETFDVPPQTTFVSGDDTSRQLALKGKSVIEHRTTVVIITKIYSLGMDFGDLNVLQFFGVPDSVVDLIQIIGRIGRTGVPALVLLHLYPPNPRDNFMYEFFEQIMAKPGVHFEPTPINALNRYAISQSTLNVVTALVMARTNKSPLVRFCNNAYDYYVKQRNAEELLRDLLDIYRRSFATPREMSDIHDILVERLKFLFSICQGKDVEIVELLRSKGLLLSSLRGESSRVEYIPTTRYMVMDSIETDIDTEDRALIIESRDDETPVDVVADQSEGGKAK